VPKTLLAVDDSVTIRKALEITFSGEDFRVVSADSKDAALKSASESPDLVLIDATLGSDGDGYAIAKELRAKLPKAAILMMASRYVPYDAAKGQEAGVDDFFDKPFDTQQIIDKSRKCMTTRESGVAAPAVAAPAASVHSASTAEVKAVAAPPPSASKIPNAPPPVPGGPGAAGKPRAATLMFGTSPAGPPPAISGKPDPAITPAHGNPKPVMEAAKPTPVAVSVPAAAPTAAAAPVATQAVAQAVNGAIGAKLSSLGLTKEQAEGVLALSRDLVERVVWEVVPQLAETMIREELARLTKEA
jgi:CheY-like chemotaxis protein